MLSRPKYGPCRNFPDRRDSGGSGFVFLRRARRGVGVFGGDGSGGRDAGGDAADGVGIERFRRVDRGVAILPKRPFFLEDVLALCRDVDPIRLCRWNHHAADQHIQDRSRRRTDIGRGKARLEFESDRRTEGAQFGRRIGDRRGDRAAVGSRRGRRRDIFDAGAAFDELVRDEAGRRRFGVVYFGEFDLGDRGQLPAGRKIAAECLVVGRGGGRRRDRRLDVGRETVRFSDPAAGAGVGPGVRGREAGICVETWGSESKLLLVLLWPES
jgi:hypothetical protein